LGKGTYCKADRQKFIVEVAEGPDKLPQSNDARWKLTREHASASLKRSHEISPDGIPYKAYKKLGRYAIGFLFDVAEDLQENGAGVGDAPSSFNHAFIMLLTESPIAL
jgi:hypothetical protein